MTGRMESAGMDFDLYIGKYQDRSSNMGGLDIQTTIGFGDFDRLKSEIERVVKTFSSRGLLFCTSDFIQDHCSIEKLAFAPPLNAVIPVLTSVFPINN